MKRRLLVISQVFRPDPASVGQHIADAAEEMEARGWSITVLTADRGYDDPSKLYPRRETRDRIDIIRFPFSSFGKRSMWHRLAAQISFCAQVVVWTLRRPRPDLVLITTIPVLSTAIGLLLNALLKVPIAFWVMDINPDEAVAAGKARANGIAVRMLEYLNAHVLNRAAVVITLDRFMARNLELKNPSAVRKIRVLPPWPHETHLVRIEHENNPFRSRFDLTGKFVVMYSGNHSLVHPLTTLLEAARAMKDDQGVVFCFIGGGAGKGRVADFAAKYALKNVLLLPYQPLDEIKFSLSAADLHVVSMGNEMVGIIHPCKFYGAMALAKPVLCFGPAESHVADVVRDDGCGWLIEHGDVGGTVTLVGRLARGAPELVWEVGSRGRLAIDQKYGEKLLRSQFAGFLEDAVQ